MHTATQMARMIRRWNLTTLDQRVVEEHEDPLDDVVRKTMCHDRSGVRGGRYRNVREFVTTNRELMKLYAMMRVRPHARYSLMSNG